MKNSGTAVKASDVHTLSRCQPVLMPARSGPAAVCMKMTLSAAMMRSQSKYSTCARSFKAVPSRPRGTHGPHYMRKKFPIPEKVRANVMLSARIALPRRPDDPLQADASQM